MIFLIIQENEVGMYTICHSDAVGERVKSSTQYHASHHGWSPGAHFRAPGGVQVKCAVPPEALGF